MIKVNERSIDWALKHINKYGDTDIFPIPFEYEAITNKWDTKVRQYILDQDLTNWVNRPQRKTLMPKHKYGFRVATQLDPIDNLIFTSLVYDLGQDIENSRLPKENNIAFSHRFLPSQEGDFYDKDYNWKQFQNRSEELANTAESIWEDCYVVVADIADFYTRIYSHPLENALKECTSKNNHVKVITKMLNNWNYSVSYGIPVGPSATRLLAELVIDDVDRYLISEGAIHCRYVDDCAPRRSVQVA